MEWYYVRDNQRVGPVTQAEFEAQVAAGIITAQTLIWRAGMAEWQPYATVFPPGDAAAGDDTAVCAVSGKRYPKREMIQFEGRWISAEHRDRYFQQLREGIAPVGGVGAPAPYGYGGFWIRFGARFIDGLILGVANIVLSFGFGMIIGTSVGAAGARPNLGRIIFLEGTLLLIMGLLALSYEVFFVRKYDATPGKLVVGLKIVRSDGAKLSILRIIGRQFSRLISGMILYIGYIMAGVDEEKRALHDRICDTRVVLTRA